MTKGNQSTRITRVVGAEPKGDNSHHGLQGLQGIDEDGAGPHRVEDGVEHSLGIRKARLVISLVQCLAHKC